MCASSEGVGECPNLSCLYLSCLYLSRWQGGTMRLLCCSVLPCVAVCCCVLQCVAVCCSALQCVAVCCSVSKCVAVCYSVLQCDATRLLLPPTLLPPHSAPRPLV